MKYQLEIELNLSREKAVAIFDNPENMKHWQEGFISMELISGVAGKAGAKSMLKYKMGKRDIEMIETITERRLPAVFSAIYEAKGVWNEAKNYFHESGEQQCRWVSENEFRMSGFMKIMAWVMPSAFKKQSFKFMQDFKTFAEAKNKSL